MPIVCGATGIKVLRGHLIGLDDFVFALMLICFRAECYIITSPLESISLTSSSLVILLEQCLVDAAIHNASSVMISLLLVNLESE